MIDTLAQYCSWTHAASVLAVDVAAKSAALCLATWIVGWALGRRRVLARSALWNATLAGLLLLPVAGASFPRLPMISVLEPTSAPFDDALSATTADKLEKLSATVETNAETAPAAGPSLVRQEPATVPSDDGGRIGWRSRHRHLGSRRPT